MHLSKLTLHNWKNFKTATANLEKRAFIIGPNASGKSNFLDAILFLREVSTTGLNQAVQKRGGVSQIRCLSARESPSIGIEATIANESGRDIWFYKIDINQDKSRKPILRTEYIKDIKHSKVLIERPEKLDIDDPLRLTQTALEQIGVNKEFRQIADFFSTISYQHLIPQVVRDPKNFSPLPVSNDPYGRDLLLRIHETSPIIRDARLKRIAYVLQQAVPQLISLKEEMDSKGSPHLIGRYKHWRQHEAIQNESQFSDGTLRLFGLLWAMLEGSGPILLEEPELSLHSEVVRNLPQMIIRLQEEVRKMKRKKGFSTRQVIISTHSPELLSDPGIDPIEVIRIEPSPEGSKLMLSGPNEKKLIKAGLTIAEAILPLSNPINGQFHFDF